MGYLLDRRQPIAAFLWCARSILVLLLGCCASALAQPASEGPSVAASPAKFQDPLKRDTPQSAVSSFLEAAHANDYRQAQRYLDLRKLSAAERRNDGTELAQELAQILDRDGQFDVASLSRNPEGDSKDGPNRARVDSFTSNGKTLELQLERVALRSGASIWLFSSESVQLIPQLAQMTSDSPIEKYLPEPMVSWKLMATPMWRWIALGLLAAALIFVSRWLSRLALLWTDSLLKRIAPRMDRSLLTIFMGPLRLLFSVAGFRAGVEWIDPSMSLRLYLERGLTLLFFTGVAWLCTTLVDLALTHLRVSMGVRHQNFSYSVLPLASRLVKLSILFVTLAAVLSSWGYNTTTILAGLGVGGVAIALAAQKTIENLFGSVAVITDRPVAVGDFCRFGDLVGTVEDIGLRSTRVRTLNRTLVSVPNGQFSSMTLENFSKRDKMWFHTTLNLRRDTTPDQVRELLKSITKTLADHKRVEAGTMPVRFVGVGTYSLDLEIFAYILTRDNDEFLEIQQGLLLWVLDAVDEAGTALALPTQAYYSFARSLDNDRNGAPVAQDVAPGTQG